MAALVQSAEAAERLAAQREEANGAGAHVAREAGMTYLEAMDAASRAKGRERLTLADVGLPPPAELEAATAALPDRGGEHAARRVAQATEPLKMRKYAYMLDAGHSLLFHGLGSKFELLEAVAQKLVDQAPRGARDALLVVDGFCPTLTIRALVAAVAAEVVPPDVEFGKRHVLDYVSAIAAALEPPAAAAAVTLVVHNIDGGALRAPDAQHALSALAAVPGVRLVASVDHANAPAMWDFDTYARFRWALVRVETFARYSREAAFSATRLGDAASDTRVRSAVVLLNSLSPKARDVFRLLTKLQTGGDGDGDGGGAGAGSDSGSDGGDGGPRPRKRRRRGDSAARTTFLRLFERCRDGFVTSDAASLKMFLAELETHELLERRKGADAAEQLWIPLAPSQLATVLASVDG